MKTKIHIFYHNSEGHQAPSLVRILTLCLFQMCFDENLKIMSGNFQTMISTSWTYTCQIISTLQVSKHSQFSPGCRIRIYVGLENLIYFSSCLQFSKLLLLLLAQFLHMGTQPNRNINASIRT